MNKEFKRLPRDKEGNIEYGYFQGRTKKWRIRNPLDGIGIYRFENLDKFKVSLAYGSSSLKQIYDMHEKRLDIYHKDSPNEKKLRTLFTMDMAMKDKMKDLASKDPNLMFVICSLFIVGEDEDIDNWNIGDVAFKKSDWQDYNEWDFFELALITLGISIREYTIVNQSLAEAIEKSHLERDLV